MVEFIENDNFIILKSRDKKRKITIPQATWDNLMEITKITLGQYPWGHKQIIVYGEKRIGKTIYLIHTMMEQEKILNQELTMDQCFTNVMGKTYYEVREFNDAMKRYDEAKIYIPSCHIDDAECGFSSSLWKEKGGAKLAGDLKKVIGTIGKQVIGLYFSSPAVDDILGFCQNYTDRIVHVISHSREGHEWDRIARMYSFRHLPSGTNRIDTKVDTDPFSCYLEKKYFDIYNTIRDGYTTKSIHHLEQTEENLNQLDRVNSNLVHSIMKMLADKLGES
jgi:hypothetical protein